MPLGKADFDHVRALVRAHSGVAVPHDKAYLVEARLAGLASSEGLVSAADVLDRLRAQPSSELSRRVVESMLIGETSFFRDAASFEALRKILAELGAVAHRRPLRVWSAGCSTGQEPYSIAMLVLQHAPMLAAAGFEVVATDVSEAHLARARAGVYSSLDVNRGLRASLLVRYFEQRGRDWSVNQAVRQPVSFERANLLGPPPRIAGFDVVFLRNVLIYFEREERRIILDRVRGALAPGGYLFLGAAETVAGLDTAFEPHAVGGAACFRAREETACR
jgi:chemotaxis protein methyltransferase CheR